MRVVRACAAADCPAQCGLLSLAVLQQAGSKFRSGGGFAEMRRPKRAGLAAATVAIRV